MTEQDNLESQNIEDNLPMVNYIMLHRIYDMLTLIASEIVKEKNKVDQMIQYHEAGYLLGPGPSFTPQENQES